MSKINILGIVRDIRSKTTYLTPIIEAVCNSIDAIGDSPNGKIEIIVKREPINQDLEGKHAIGNILAIDIVDNGVGFNLENRESFDTFRSSFKYEKGGKGFGRFMYLKYFDKVQVESYFYSDTGEMRKRSFVFGKKNDIIVDEVEEEALGHSQTGTILHLMSITKNSYIDKGLDVIARKLVERLLVFFVDKSKSTPQIILKEEDGSQTICLNDYVGDGRDITLVKEVPLSLGGKSTTPINLKVQVYKIFFSTMSSKISLTANKREVTDTPLHKYVPEFKDTLMMVNPTGGTKNYVVKAYVIGTFLDENVTVERDGFVISKTEDDIFSEISEAEIERATAQIVKSCFEEEVHRRLEEKKKQVNQYVIQKAPWHKSLENDIDIEGMPMSMSEQDIELRFQKCKFEKEQALRKAIHNLNNNEQDIKTSSDIVKEQVDQLFQYITEVAKNDLIHYVCNRKRFLDLFDSLRARKENGRPHLESDIHNLIYPMRRTSLDTSYDEHNLWLLDERLVFSQYIASDKVISSKDHDEPDLVTFFDNRVFMRNGDNVITAPVSIYEFKRPRREEYTDSENPITQACRYARKILEGKYEMPNGSENIKVDKEHTPVYLYIVADIVSKIKQFADEASLTETPDGEGYIGYIKAYNAYVQIMSFKKVVDDARMRNAIFFRKLGLS